MSDARAGVTPTTCPTCGRRLNAASAADGSPVRPKLGDFSVCIGCARILRFDEEREPVLAVADDLAELAAEEPETLQLLMLAHRAVRSLLTRPAKEPPP